MACECIGSAVSGCAGTLMVDYLVKPIERRIRYCFRFRKIVEELHQQKNKLITEQTRVQKDIEEAGLHIETQEIEECVYEWCTSAENALKEVKELDRRIGEDKKCYCSCPNWIWRYRLSKEMEKKTLDMSKLVEDSHFERYGRPGVLLDIDLIKSKDHVDSKSSDDAFNKIMEAVKDDNVSNVGVWGIGGVGKTTVVKQVGCEVKGFDQVIMVTVSSEPNIEKIQNQMKDFIQDFKSETTTEKGKASELLNRLKRGRFLIILDDLWNEWNDLRQIGIPLLENGKGCKVILTTRRRAVCESMKCDVTIPIDVLNDEEAWTLFRMKANLADDEAKGRGFVEEAKKVARECRGLPVAIVTLASALKGTKTLREWEVARENLENNTISDFFDLEEEKDKDKNAYRCISMSYEYLKKDATKKCFLLCALYPEDHSIKVEDLVRYAWGLELYGKVDSVEQLRWKVFKDIDYLVDSCLLLKDGDDRRNVKLHDIVRDVALWIASKKESGFVINSRLELLNESSEHCKAISWLNNEKKKIPESSVQSKLEILLIRNCENPGACFQWMKSLKVLSHTAGDLFRRPISLYALKFLQNLRALHLENFEDYSFLGDLKALEIFSLCSIRQVNVEALANELVRLEKLKILDLSGCGFNSSTLPAYFIQKLSKLEELYLQGSKISEEILDVINLSPRLTALSLSLDSVFIREDYVFPKSLVRYNISKYDRYGNCLLHLTEKSWKINSPGIPYYLVSLLSEDLESLILEYDTDGFVEVLLADKSLKLSNLKLLHLLQKESKLSRLRELPYQQVILEGLVDLKIVNFPSLKSLFPLSVAQSLVLLETLTIRECNGLEQIVIELEGNEEEISSSTINSHSPLCFSKLRKLDVEHCDGLEYIFPTLMAPEGLQRLTALSIRKCRQLKQLIRFAEDGVENDLLHLRQLEFLRSLPSFSVSDCPYLTDSIVHLEPAEGCLQEVRLSAFKESFSTSKQLTLVAIEDLECLVDNSTTENGPTSSAFTNLERLIIEKIDGLETLCKGQPPQGFLKNLKALDVGYCEELQVVLYNRKENQEQLLSNLQSLQLRWLPKLSWIFKDSAHSFTLQSLKVVKIYGCGKLESLFSTSLIRSLRFLEELDITNCYSLETIFSELENDVEKEAKSSSPPLCLPKLKTLCIHECSKLEYVVPITLAHGLPALASLSVSSCGELKQVFGMPIENHGVEHHGILQLLLPSLEDLKLYVLYNLTSFDPENYIINAPALKSLKVEDCPRVMNFPIQQVNNQLELQGVLSSAFKDFLCNTKHLTLYRIRGSQNLVPEVVGIEYLEGLTSLHIDRWRSVECLVDSTLTEAMMGSTSKYKGQLPPKLLSNLEHLQVKYSSSLRWIVKGSSNSNCVNFQSLKVLRIIECRDLEYLFPLSVLQTLSLLEEVEIEGCRKLESLFMELESDADDDDDIGIESNTFCLQNLKTVKIRNCGLKYVFSHDLAQGLPNLKTLEITDCPSLEYLFPHALAQGLQNLKTVEISDCQSLEYVFPHALAQGLQNLKTVKIKKCPSLEYVFPHALAQGLQNLKTVEIKKCPSLEYVFPHVSARGFPRLQKLQLEGVRKLRSVVEGNSFLEAAALEMLFISGCFPLKELTIDCESEYAESCKRSPNFEYKTLGNVEQVLFETQGGYFFSTLEKLNLRTMFWLRDIWKAPIHVATNLKELAVHDCDNLTHIFPLKLIPHLTQLSSLRISHCEKLKQIISNDDDDASQGVLQLMEMKMVFPQLKQIELCNMSSLESFSPAGYHLEFPCLELLHVENCSNMITSFTVDYITLTVHAKTDQASQLGDTSSSRKRLRWSSRVPTSLPQYIDEAEEISPLK